MFRLEFNLPYFRLSRPPEAASHALPRGASAKWWIDLSFLELPNSEIKAVQKLGMFEAHFSFVVCGWRENRWVAHAFDNTEPNGEDLADRIICDGLHCDPIASTYWDDILDAEVPIWNPREYFLTVVEARVVQAADSWEALLMKIERRITGYVSHQHRAKNSH